MFNLIKASGRCYCRGEKCARNPNYVNKNGRIIKNTICCALIAESSAGINYSYYCRDCIDQILMECKMTLDSRLWVLH